MKWLDRLERKFGRYAIKGLIRYIVILNGIVYLFMMTGRGDLSSLVLIPSRVLAGEVWRLITYIFIPPMTQPLFIMFILFFYYMIGDALEQTWGSFRFNLYYLLGMIGTTVAVFIPYLLGYPSYATATYLNLSLLLAFARLYPDYEIYLFFFFPIKIKYLAWFNWAYLGYTVLVEPLAFKLYAIVSVLNYLIFFGRSTVRNVKNRGRGYAYRKKIQTPKAIHKCTVCGITEVDNPEMEFRYCSKCEGDYEYCMDHLKDHEHVTKD